MSASSFEALAAEFASKPEEVYDEFVRRLHYLVFQAAHHFLAKRAGPTDTATTNHLTTAVFAEFAPEFASGSPGSLLRRFAAAIRRKLDDESFRLIAPFYYRQLVVYEIPDLEVRRVMAVAYGRGIGPDTIDGLSKRFQLPREHVVQLLSTGHAMIERIMKRDFDPGELSRETEGYLP